MPSASTLIRRARAAKNPAAAKRLRAQAAKIRREARAEAAISANNERLRKARKKPKKAKKIEDNPRFKAIRARALAVEAKQTALMDQHGFRVARIINMQGTDRFIDTVKEMIEAERHEAAIAATEPMDAKIKEIHDVHRINVVCSFMAKLEGVQRANNGTLPPIIVTSGFEAARIYSALRDAGYTRDGKNGVERSNIQYRRGGQAVGGEAVQEAQDALNKHRADTLRGF